MPNTIKYGTEIENNTLKKGNFVIGVNDVDYGPTSETGYHNTITPPEGGYVVYKNRGDNERSIYVAESDEELVLLKDDFGATGSTANDILVWASQQSDVIILNNPLDNIVTDGLVLYLDAGFTCSYPKSNTTWYDLSGNGNDETLVNGPTFSDGSLVFDGSDDYIQGKSSNEYGLDINLSLECWFKTTASFGTNSSSTAGRIINLHRNSPGTNISLQVGSDGLGFYHYGNSSFYKDNTNVSTGEWIHAMVVVDGNNTKLYRNNGVVINVNGNNISTFSSYPLIISSYDGDSRFFDGNLSIVRIYNKSLTADEVLQNYNAQKSRFGL